MNARPRFKNLRSELLTDETVQEWLQRQEYHLPRDVGPLDARIKILLCNETENTAEESDVLSRSKSVHMSRESFNAAEEHLHLPVHTLPTTNSIWGVQSSEFIVHTNKVGKEAIRLG